jgi:hypothetical protein
MDPIPYKGQISRSEFMLMEHITRNPRKRRGGFLKLNPNVLLAWVGITMFLASILYFVFLAGFQSDSFFCTPFLIGLYLAAIGFRKHQAWLTTWRLSDEKDRNQEGLITETHIVQKWKFGEHKYSWAIINDFLLSHDVMLLFDNSRIFQFFPKHFFASEDDWQAFLALVREKLPLDAG